MLLRIIDDLRVDVASLEGLFRAARSSDPKVTALVDRFERGLSKVKQGLEALAKQCRYAYRELYTWLLFMLQRYRQTIYLLHTVYGLISLRGILRENRNAQRSLSLADEYVDSLIGELDVPADFLIFVTPESEYASLPIPNVKVFIIILPLTNLAKPWKWVLLSHELGHLYYQLHRDEILTTALPAIEEELRDSIRDKEIRIYMDLWCKYWLQEIVSDIVAVGLCGPAYLKMLVMEATEPKPARVYASHPPLDARARAQIKYLQLIGAPEELTRTIERVWKEYREKIDKMALLPDYLSESIVERVSNIMADILQDPFIVTSWRDFKRVLGKLPDTKGEDLKLLIPAMALKDIYRGL